MELDSAAFKFSSAACANAQSRPLGRLFGPIIRSNRRLARLVS
jgi:hypothetical protein